MHMVHTLLTLLSQFFKISSVKEMSKPFVATLETPALVFNLCSVLYITMQ
ncbi:hypothetical protein KC19_4G241300 [Ceratodon purpureus]|uniref:Uncharacterized protein n=1 Tax=Ceratodon purpureus TaxID=3225 RepID=A0A8T0IEI9_CERPU|nr:hypothetical protein KC19_4G241300 [Ceratodon purpureus]